MNALLQPEIQFRPLQTADLDNVMEIELDIYPYPWTRGNFSDSLKAGHSCWACTYNGNLIGYTVLMMSMDEAHLLNIGIANSYQLQGYGRKLLEHIIHTARNQGGQMMFLEVRPSNKTALKLYENIGFNEFSRRKDYYPADNGREDALLMGLAL